MCPQMKNNIISPNSIFDEGIKSLNEKMDKFQKSTSSRIDSEFYSIKNVVSEKLSSIERETKNYINDQTSIVENQIKNCNSNMIQTKREISCLVESKNNENTKRNTLFLNSLEVTNKKINDLSFLLEESNRKNSLQYVEIKKDINTFVETYNRDKSFPDEKTLICKDGKVSFAYKFNEKDFRIKNNEINATGFLLNNGNHVSADRIHDDLTVVLYSTKSLTYKVDSIIKKLNNTNGYLASNNFKKEDPSQEQLTNFAISCISNATDSAITKEKIPNGTKIKNTFDNHIWVFNHIFHNGLTIYKWEDFGSDNVCIANNSGVLGLVAGSQEKYRGFVDIKGSISINGLEEELAFLSNSIKSLSASVEKYIMQIDVQFKNIENRLGILENK